MCVRLTLLASFLLVSICLFGQIQDSLKSQTFENFFGSPCDTDTIVEKFGDHQEVILYMKERKLNFYKDNELKWSMPLSFDDKPNNWCLLILEHAKFSRYVGYAMVTTSSDSGLRILMKVKLPRGNVISD